MDWWAWIAFVVILFFGLVVLRGAPYVPTKRKLLDNVFDKLYPLQEDDVVVDIGCGDGVVLRAAAARGARAIGYELNPILVIIAKLLSRHPRITIILADFWYADLPSDTTVIYTFGESRDIKKMYQKAERTAAANKKEIAFISFGFQVPDVKPVGYDGSFYLYRIKPLQRRKA